MAPLIALSWRRAGGSNDNINDVPAGQNVSSDSAVSTPRPSHSGTVVGSKISSSPLARSSTAQPVQSSAVPHSSYSAKSSQAVASSALHGSSVVPSSHYSSVQSKMSSVRSSSEAFLPRSSSLPASSKPSHSRSRSSSPSTSHTSQRRPASSSKTVPSSQQTSILVPRSSVRSSVGNSGPSSIAAVASNSALSSPVPSSHGNGSVHSTVSFEIIVGSTFAPGNLNITTSSTIAPSSTIVPSSVIASSSAILSSSTITSSSTASSQSSVTSSSALTATATTQKSNHKAAIIGGAVGGAVLILLLLAFYCFRKRSRGKRDSETATYGSTVVSGPASQHPCCNPALKNAGHGHAHRAAPVPTPEMKQVPHGDSLNDSRRTGSISPSGSSRSNRSSTASWRNRRPPPLQLESLVTPVLSGPSNGNRKDPFKDPSKPHLPNSDLGADPFNDPNQDIHGARRAPGSAIQN